MLKFIDKRIINLDINKLYDVKELIIKNFCGIDSPLEINSNDAALLKQIINNLTHSKISFEGLNEIMLLLNQNRVSKDFYKFFFSSNKISQIELKKGIIKFRGYALLCYGNIRYAFLHLAEDNFESLEKKLKPFSSLSTTLLMDFKKRENPIIDIEKIDKEFTWLTGYLSGKKLSKEIGYIEKEIEEFKKTPIEDKYKNIERLNSAWKVLKKIDDKKILTIKSAEKNTDIYLMWEYMDVYIATSMRNSWEFEEVSDLINKLREFPKIKNLKVRFFDPTQSYCINRIEKGLIEGLMLKRAKFLVYMVQESDTMGKDSELAATLAQGKPVIAYIPKFNIEKYAKKIENFPLEYFKKRLLILQADEIFQDEDCVKKLIIFNENYESIIENFIEELKVHENYNPITLWKESELKFKRTSKYFLNICKVLAISEDFNFDKRAELLKRNHPLAMQVDLKTGVANGVLVIRNIKSCAQLIYNFLTNDLLFEFNYTKVGNNKETIELIEKSSQSIYRVIVQYKKLVNAFWNFYLKC